MTALATSWELPDDAVALAEANPAISSPAISTPTIQTRAISTPAVGWVLQPVPESRPPVVPLRSAARTAEARPRVPTLFDAPEPAMASVPTSRHRMVTPPGGVGCDPALPDPVDWCATLTPALLEVLQRRRPLNQLARWLDDPVLGRLTVALRLRQRAGTPVPPRAAVVTLRVQCPTPEAAEVSVHVRLPQRSAALAYRLDALPSRRWLCTALDLGDAALLGALPRTLQDRYRRVSDPAAATTSARV